ncbi:condensin subunit Smc [Chthonomonas calidirosea]|uniref:chromosome segregation protein SMC n=1 Tax=Chthonomonas calidirosea TaxID=454171 RepID=UPI0006DD51B5|nr:chromosome segregation protein SMC [Chthonomonas calidirosea]CEK13151.1 condensin subunit Smc [Chthonomonas calidirosea]
MQLKQLQLLGFKTFADRIEFQIGPGLTAIVGPNGSGKSNIVDAILWVLGEQNPRLLRAERAQDVIFSGSDKRKPLGMAEVRLLLDNSDHFLPISFSEVSISRRIYRSGESQYFINGAPCRMKDIVELFLDTGAGKGAYAVVGQQEVDAVLSARPEDRRELFEEAAGIKKYRVKKREALRKLEAAEANLQRVRDILRELEAQKEPLERQVIAARRYLGYQERLREIEVGLLVAEAKQADYELYGIRQEQELDRAELHRIEIQQAQFEQHLAELTEQVVQVEENLEIARTNHQNLLSMAERLQSRIAVLEERARAAVRTKEQALQEIAELNTQKELLENLIASEAEESARLQAELAEREQAWAAEQAALQAVEQAVAEILRELEAQRSQQLRRAEERAGRLAALDGVKARLDETRQQLDALLKEATLLQEQRLQAEERLRQLTVEQAQRRAQRDELFQTQEHLETQQKGLQAEADACRNRWEAARRAYSEQAARLSTLIELQESYEGFYHGVRALLQAARAGAVRGDYRPVVDLLTVPKPYRIAIEVALGSSLQDIVTPSAEEAKAGIAWLKQHRAGRVTFLPLTLLRPGRPLDPLPAEEGIEGVAVNLVGFDNRYAPAIQLLLGRVVVVRNLDTAITLSRRLSGWSRMVTLEGELLTPGGALTGGSLQGLGAHLVGRKGEIDDLKTRLPDLQAEVDRLATQHKELLQKQQETAKEHANLVQELANLDQAIAIAAGTQAAAERELARLQRQEVEHQQAQQLLKTRIGELEKEQERLENLILSRHEDDTDAENALIALQQEVEIRIAKRDALRSNAARLEVETTELRTQLQGLKRSQQENRQALEELQRRIEQRKSLHAQIQQEEAQVAEETTRLAEQRQQILRQLQEAEKSVQQCLTSRQQKLDAHTKTNEALREATQRHREITVRLHETELRIARLEMQLSQAAERLLQEYNLPIEQALCYQETVALDENTVREVARLRREIRAMGHVNTGAIEEFERLTERCDFLTTQQADLEKSRAGLLDTISEIDASTRDIFLQTFEAVREEFDRLFKRLFGGGSAQLLLTNPNDLLETGIEIIAQPPGKKAQNLSLLSGGERALTAIALLFAFLSVRPSPFVILDEVDAPLDGANVEKFVQLVREFSERSQFLVITHNPVTMEAAPIWYGVTMREPGVSSIISYRVPQLKESDPTQLSEVGSPNGEKTFS